MESVDLDLIRLGESGLVASEVGLGLAALGRPGYINLGHRLDLSADYDIEAMRQHAHLVLDAAWGAGVRYFDAARSYGRAEQYLGSWLRSREIDRGDVTIGSKWGYRYTAGWKVDAEVHEEKEHSAARLLSQVAESREHLGDYLDLYQVHSATVDSGAFSDDVLDELANLKSQGLHIGLSTTGASQSETIRCALEIVRDGVLLFETVQSTWNMLEQSAGDSLEEAHEAGLGVILKETVANGRLTRRNDLDYDRIVVGELTQAASLMFTGPDGVAIEASRRRPFGDVVLSGAAAVEQIEANLRRPGAGGWEPDWDKWILQYREDPDEYWRVRSNLPWN